MQWYLSRSFNKYLCVYDKSFMKFIILFYVTLQLTEPNNENEKPQIKYTPKE